MLGHQNTLMQSYWEIMIHHKGCVKFPSTTLNLENHMTESLQLSTFISLNQLQKNIQNDPDPKTMAEYKKRSDWNQWKDAIQAELSSLSKRKVFTHAIPTPRGIFPVGFKWVFVRKQNENNEVALGFTQRPGVDFNETYSPVMSGITFRYLISLAIQNCLSMQLMDVVTAYLYGSLDSYIYMKVPDGISIPDQNANRNIYCVKFQKSLYGLK